MTRKEAAKEAVKPARDVDGLEDFELEEVRVDLEEPQTPSIPQPSPPPSPQQPASAQPSPQQQPQRGPAPPTPQFAPSPPMATPPRREPPPAPASPPPAPVPRLETVDAIIASIEQLHPLERAALSYALNASDAVIQKISTDDVMDYLRRLGASPAVLEALKIWLGKCERK